MRFLLAQNRQDLRWQARASTFRCACVSVQSSGCSACAVLTGRCCRHQEGRRLSVLDGVPFVVIDAIDADGYRTSAGTSFVRSHGCSCQQG